MMEMALIKAVVVAREMEKVAKVEQELISAGQARVYSMVVCFERMLTSRLHCARL